MSYSDDDLRMMWLANGGNFHGPNVETGTMSEALLLPLLRTMLTISRVRWIDARVRLPRPGQEVVYYFEVTGATHGRFERGTCQADALFSSRMGFLTGDVTHWMPMPEDIATPNAVGEPTQTVAGALSELVRLQGQYRPEPAPHEWSNAWSAAEDALKAYGSQP